MRGVGFFSGIAFLVVFLSSEDSYAQEIQSDSTYHSCFFREKSFSFGIATERELSIPMTGGQARLYYNFRKNVCFGPEIALTNGAESKSRDFNLVIHYIHELFGFGLYPVIGLSLTREIEKGHSQNDWGAMTGFGLHRNWRKMIFFSEYSHSFVWSGTDKVSVGIMYMFAFNQNKD